MEHQFTIAQLKAFIADQRLFISRVRYRPENLARFSAAVFRILRRSSTSIAGSASKAANTAGVHPDLSVLRSSRPSLL
jgi:hypothetical protein